MKLKLHHINFATKNVDELATFYRDVMELTDDDLGLSSNRVKDEGYPGDVAFMSDGDIQFHLAERDLEIGFRTGMGLNPVDRGHIAFRTDDMEGFKARLKERGIPFADGGSWAMKGWDQIFFYDPDGNVVEVHQVEADAVGA